MCTICLDDSLLSPVMDLDYYLIRLNKELMNMTQTASGTYLLQYVLYVGVCCVVMPEVTLQYVYYQSAP